MEEILNLCKNGAIDPPVLLVMEADDIIANNPKIQDEFTENFIFKALFFAARAENLDMIFWVFRRGKHLTDQILYLPEFTLLQCFYFGHNYRSAQAFYNHFNVTDESLKKVLLSELYVARSGSPSSISYNWEPSHLSTLAIHLKLVKEDIPFVVRECDCTGWWRKPIGAIVEHCPSQKDRQKGFL